MLEAPEILICDTDEAEYLACLAAAGLTLAELDAYLAMPHGEVN